MKTEKPMTLGQLLRQYPAAIKAEKQELIKESKAIATPHHSGLRVANNQISIVGELRNLTVNRGLNQLFKRAKKLRPDSAVVNKLEDRIIRGRQLWTDAEFLQWTDSEDPGKFPELTAVFDDDVIFFGHFNPTSLRHSSVLTSMRFITGTPDSVISAMSPNVTMTDVIDYAAEYGVFDFGRKLLTSYQQIANYLIIEKSVPLTVPRTNHISASEKLRHGWYNEAYCGQDFALNKAQAGLLHSKFLKEQGPALTVYTNDHVLFFVKFGTEVKLPTDFVKLGCHIGKDLFEQLALTRECPGGVLYGTKNVVDYLDAHYSLISK